MAAKPSKSYYHTVAKDKGNLFWKVMEAATDREISRYTFEEDAEHHAEFLRSGGGFAGATPSFMWNIHPSSEIKTMY